MESNEVVQIRANDVVELWCCGANESSRDIHIVIPVLLPLSILCFYTCPLLLNSCLGVKLSLAYSLSSFSFYRNGFRYPELGLNQRF